MTNTHTPGHWGHRQHTGNNSRVIIGHDLSPIGLAYELPDARLIAAAPDLLAASRAALAALQALRDAPQGGAEVMLRAAIAKAEGR